jgi:hypothetical protein
MVPSGKIILIDARQIVVLSNRRLGFNSLYHRYT